ncbi:MAG: MopE-related protein [Pseudomonadota bacterium]
MRPSPLVALLALCGCPTENIPGVRNADPRADITSHGDGDTPDAGLRQLVGVVDDPDHDVGELVASWRYEGAEACPPLAPDENGLTTCEIFLEAGARGVSLQVEDPLGGLGSDQVTLEVQPYGDPWVEILSPQVGGVYYSDRLVSFEGTVGDAADPPAALEAWWESSLDGLLAVEAAPDGGGGVIGSGYLSEGDHQLLLKVRNTGGNEAYDALTLTVGPPNSPPDCAITAPSDGAEVEHGVLVTFEATVSDPDVPADWLSTTWTSHLDGALGTVTPDTDGSVTLPVAGLSAGAHTISLAVSDELGARCTDSVVLTVMECDTPWYRDGDGDGYGDPAVSAAGCDQPSGYLAEAGDCDDSDPEIHPGATERCDGVDDDCDGTVDEADAADALTWYADADGDGYGDAGVTTTACAAPTGFVADLTDCDDGAAAVNPGATELCDGVDDDCDGVVDEADAADAPIWYQDGDGDGYGDSLSTAVACAAPSGFVADGGDCDDLNSAFHPGAPEPDCTDPADYDCDGITAYADADGDGWAACVDCDDSDAAVNPAATERCDGVDDDCDGAVDEADAVDASTWYADADGDGYGDAGVTMIACAAPTGFVADATDCDDAAAATHPGAMERCDGVDTDCDGTLDEDDAVDATTWYADMDGDGYGDAGSTAAACTAPAGYLADATDCDDGAAAVNPGAAEICDGVDDDCDGSVDEDDAVDAVTWWLDSDGDGYGGALYSVVACSQPAGFEVDATDCLDTSAAVYPGTTERCNGIDDDCDGATDEPDATDATTWYADADGDGFGDATSTAPGCTQPSGYVASATDCDDDDPDAWPGATEHCDGVDTDCDGTVDEDDAVDALTWYRDGDGDGYGDAAAFVGACSAPAGYLTDATDCDDGVATTHPSATDLCDGVDNDCDGTVDYDIVGLHFTSYPDWVAIPDDNAFDLGTACTIEAWVYYEGGGMVFNKMVGNAEDKLLAVDPSVLGWVWGRDGSGAWTLATRSSTTVVGGTWSHIAFVYDGSEARVYLNGVLSGTTTATVAGRDIGDSTGTAYIGSSPRGGDPQQPLEGIIADVRISRSAKYTTDFSPDTYLGVEWDTRGLWALDEGSGTTAFDYSAYGNDGTIAGAIWTTVTCRGD